MSTALAVRDAPVSGRIPPHDLDAEAAVLGASLLDLEAFVESSRLLEPHHFYSESNRRIFEAIGDVYKVGGRVDVINVAARLRETGRLEQVGGMSYLAKLLDEVPAVAHIEDYAKIVRNHARTRNVLATCQAIVAEAYGVLGGETADAFVEESQAALGRACEVEERSPIVGAWELTEAFTKSLTATDIDTLGLKLGFIDIDKLLSCRMGEVTVIAARPGMGKTAFMMGAIVNMTLPQRRDPDDPELPTAAGVFSLEMPKEQLWARAACSHAYVDYGKLQKRAIDGDDHQRLAAACEDLAKLPIWMDDTASLSIGALRTKVRLMKHHATRAGHQLRVVAVDYVQLMTSGTRGVSREQEISEITRNLKRLAKEERIHVIALAQLNREVEDRSPPIPQLSDLRESGAIEQDADNVVFLYRQEYYEIQRQKTVTEDTKGMALAIIGKQRNGTTGSARLKFWASMVRFDNFSDRDWQ